MGPREFRTGKLKLVCTTLLLFTILFFMQHMFDKIDGFLAHHVPFINEISVSFYNSFDIG